MIRRERLWLCVGPVAFCLLDQSLTLLGQAPAYWSGAYLTALDGNPIIAWFLQRHPATLAVETALWILTFGLLVVFLPWRRVAFTLSLAVALGHVVGATTWLWWSFEQYWLFPVLLTGSAVLLVWTWERAGMSGLISLAASTGQTRPGSSECGTAIRRR